MSHYIPTKLVALWVVIKGAVIASVTVLILGTTFVQSLVIALVSGGLGAIGMVFAAWVAAWKSAEEARHNRAILQDIKRNTTTDRRDGDARDREDTDA